MFLQSSLLVILAAHLEGPSTLTLTLTSPVGPCSVDTAIPLSGSKVPRLSAPRPLFLPTTLIVGDSIIRNTRFFNAATHFFPGATVPVIPSKLPGLLRSLPSSVRRVIVHVRTYDTAREQSELIKKDSFHFHFHVTRVSTFLVPSPLWAVEWGVLADFSASTPGSSPPAQL